MSRKTWHYDPETKEMVEGPGPRRVDGPSGDSWRFSDRMYSDSPFVGSDGTVIDSRKKHREYMKRNGLTTMDDYKGAWDKAAQERKAFFEGTHSGIREERKADVRRALERLRSR
jgi:hypothetical protein